MANFDRNKYRIDGNGGFDRSQYKSDAGDTRDPHRLYNELKDRLMHAAQQEYARTVDLGSGVREGLQNTGAWLTSHLPEDYKIPHYKAQPTAEEHGTYAIEAGKFLSAFAPGGIAQKAVRGGAALAKLPAWLGRLAEGVAGGVGSAPALDISPETGAKYGIGGALIPEAFTLGSSALGKFLGKNVTPEQFELARQAVPKDIKAPIGELADSPRAKTLYDASRAIAFSAADEPYKQLYEHLKRGTQELVEDAPSVENASQFIYDDVKKSYEAAKKITNNDYDALAKHADINNVRFVSNKYLDSINKSLKEINNRSTTPVSIEKDLKVLSSSGQPFTKTSISNVPFNKDVSELYKQSVETLKNFKKTPINTFKDAVNLRKSLNKIIKKRYKSDDLESASFLEQIKSGLDDSIAESAAQNPELFSLHKAANNSRIKQGTFEKLNRRDQSPFHKIYSKDGAPTNFIGSYLKPVSRKGDDFSALLSSLTSKLSPEAKDVLGKTYLQPREGESLAKQMTKLKGLSPTQRELLFDDKAELAHSLAKISSTFPKATAAGFTPETGYTGGKAHQAMHALQRLAEYAGVGTAVATHHPAALAGALALPAYGRLSQYALRSNALKNAYARYLKTAKGKPLTKSKFREQLLRTMALSATGDNNNGS